MASPCTLRIRLVLAALDEARAAGSGSFSVRFRLTENAPAALRSRSGARGRLALTRVSYRGFEREDRLVATAVFEDAEVLRPGSRRPGAGFGCRAKTSRHPHRHSR